MADETTQDTQDQPTPEPATGEDTLGDAGKKALDAMKADRNLARTELNALKRDFDKLKATQMTESEKALAEAEARGRTAVTVEFGQRLAAAQFVAQAAKRNADFDAASVLEDLNLAKYVTDSGDPDIKGIASVVDRLVPERAANPRPTGDVGLGPRPAAPAPTDGSPRSLIASGIAASDAAKR